MTLSYNSKITLTFFLNCYNKSKKKSMTEIPDKESVHLFQAKLQNLFFKISINLCSNL